MDAPRTPRAGRGFTAFLAVACAVLAVQVLVLSGRNRELRAALAEAGAGEGAATGRDRLEVGDVLEPFHVRAGDGSVERVAFDARATLLLVFAEECPACPAVYPEWEVLVGPFESAALPVIGLRLDPPDAPATREPPDRPFPVRALTDAREVPLAALATVPLTVLLDGGGRVRWRRYGALTDEHLAELLTFLEP